MQTVGHWDASEDKWSEEEISLVEFADDSRTITFSTTRLTSLAVLQPTHLELPYKKWIFTPSTTSSGTLYLTTQRFEMRIDISAKGCTLRAPVRAELESRQRSLIDEEEREAEATGAKAARSPAKPKQGGGRRR